MNTPQPFTKEPAFVNREDELAYLETWISAMPENILFLYGPKSSGKTTLIYRFIERIYQDSKLKKTSRLLEIKYIGYEDVMHWLSNLNAYSKIDRFVLSDGQKQAIWEFFGSSHTK